MKSKKGVAGKGTGASARRHIKRLNSNRTYAQIGRLVGRDESTISAIANGAIKNPPANLISRLSKVKGKKK